MNGGGDKDDGDFYTLPLNARLSHKLWKARLHGYQELNSLFSNAAEQNGNNLGHIIHYWRDPSLFGEYVTDANVAAQEQAVIALESLVKNVGLPKNVELKTAMSNWIPALVEKGLASSRVTTKNKSLECIILLCSLDESIAESVLLILPFFDKKLPKLVAGAINCITELIKAYGFVNTPIKTLLPEVLDPLGRLAGHADRNVRAQTMSLIVEIYKANGRNRMLLQELLLNKLKPIQQNDLEKLFNKVDTEPANDDGPHRLFQWQSAQVKEQQEHTEAQHELDKDGDTLMEMKVSSQATESQAPLDPFDLIPEETILDKLPPDFHTRITSAKWKDRVESLQELWDTVLSKIKKLKSENQDYTELLSIYAHIIQRDANVQAVTLAAQSVERICDKLRLPGFSKHYATIVFVPLLERTKEKKPSVLEPIRTALRSICKLHNPLGSEKNNEDMLLDILQCMKSKIPQSRLEGTTLFTFIIKKCPISREVISKFLDEEIIPTVVKIVNDTQQTIRSSGFECLGELIIKIGRNQTLNSALEKLDSLKRKKIEEYCDQEASSKSQTTSRQELDESHFRVDSQIRPSTSSSIPSKRGATSPLKKVVKTSSPNVQKSRILLTTRSLATPGSPSTLGSTKFKASTFNENSNIQLQKLIKEKQEWIKERAQLTNRINELTVVQSQISDENEAMREQLRSIQYSFHERELQLKARDVKLDKLQGQVLQLEQQLRHSRGHEEERQQQKPEQLEKNGRISSSDTSSISTNLGVRSISSSSFEPITTRTKHLRTPSESSDDLPRRVDSLQLNHNNSNHTADIVNEESWKRAAEVTSQLKARIERMRAKTKGIHNNF